MNINNEIIGMLAIMKYSTRKMLMSRRLLISGLVLLFVVAVMGYAGSQADDFTRLNMGLDLLDGLILFFFMPILAMIYGSSVIRDEIDDKSITQIVTAPMHRASAYLAYYISLVVAISIIMVVMVIAGYISFFSQAGFEGNAHGPFLSICILVVIGAIVYSSLFLLVSVVMKQPIYFGLFYAFIWESLLGSVEGIISRVAIKHYVRSIGTSWIQYGDISNYDATAAGRSAAILVVLTMVMIITGAFLFSEKEFP